MPPIEAPATYEKLETGDWYDEAWRDPWVFRDPSDGWFHAYVTARVPHGDRFDRGVIGHIRSSDMRTWEALAPVTRPMGMGQMEVPQLVELENRWYLVYCSDVETQAPGRRAAVAGTGTFYLVGDSPYGPFEAIGDGTLEADPHGSAYAGKLHRTSADELVFISWNRSRENGDFLGTIGDPRHVDVAGDGRLTVLPA